MSGHQDFKGREIMLRRRMPFRHVAFATLLGVGGGIYIYRPYYELQMKTSEQQKEDVPKKDSEKDNSS